MFMEDARRNAWLAQLFAGYLRYFPIKKGKKAISGRVGPHLVSVPLKAGFGFYLYHELLSLPRTSTIERAARHFRATSAFCPCSSGACHAARALSTSVPTWV
jgi:hypothetical protein